MKLRFIAIGISAAVMLSAVACSKKDAGAAVAAPETVIESAAEDVSDDITETVLDEVSKAAAEYVPEDGSEVKDEDGSIRTNNTDTASSNEVTIEIVTGKNIQQTLAANATNAGSGSEQTAQRLTAVTENLTSGTKAQEQTAATDNKTSETKATEQITASETNTQTQGTASAAAAKSKNGYSDGAKIGLDSAWKYADYSVINSGTATMYLAKSNRKDKIIGINAGHGTSGGTNVKTWCHPDKTAKVTGGTTAAGATQAVAVSTGMSFNDGTKESTITLKEAQMVKNILLERGYDVLMIRDGDDVQLDNVARTVICNNAADCHIAIHWDGDGLDYDKGCFYMSVPDGIKYLDSVAATWQSSEALGNSLIAGLKGRGCKIFGDGTMDMDLTQTSYSTVPSIDIELGNQSSDHSDAALQTLALGIADGVESFFG